MIRRALTYRAAQLATAACYGVALALLPAAVASMLAFAAADVLERRAPRPDA